MKNILTYNESKRIFIKKEYSKTNINIVKNIDGGIGDAQNSSFTFFSINKWAIDTIGKNSFFNFDTPLFYTNIGTYDYLSQDPNSVFTNSARPSIIFNFYKNTDKLSYPNLIIKHELYKIDYDTYKNHLLEISSTKKVVNKFITKTSNNNPREKEIEETQKVYFDGTDYETQHQEIVDLLETPVLTITASTSAITSTMYRLQLVEYFKNLGNYKSLTFENKSQYFLKTNFVFQPEKENEEYSNYYILNNKKQAEKIDYNKIFSNNYQTSIKEIEIPEGPFKGVTVGGLFFTYFSMPPKPKLLYPIVQGQLNTFTPSFYFENTSKSQTNYILQVVYDIQDFSGIHTIYSYPFKKSDVKEDIDLSGVSTQRVKITAPVKPGRLFWYRIANQETLMDIFNVKRSAASFSQEISAITQNSPAVVVNSDSPYVTDVSTFTTPTYFVDPSTFLLSGTVTNDRTGNTIEGASVTLNDISGNSFTQLTTNSGTYEFNNVLEGNYTATTIFTGFHDDNESLLITSNTVHNVKLLPS